MLIAILMLFFASDLRELEEEQLVAVGCVRRSRHPTTGGDSDPVHTFNLLALAELGQTTEQFDGEILFGKSLQWWAFVLLFIGFHHQGPGRCRCTPGCPTRMSKRPTPISMILAGVLLKMGGYGILRIAFPLCPYGAQAAAWTLVAIGAISIIYGAFAAMAQTDFKRLVAYSSVSHMGYVILGIAVWKITEDTYATTNSQYWKMGINGAMFQMLGHGVFLRRDVLHGRRDLRPRASPRLEQVRRPDGPDAAV